MIRRFVKFVIAATRVKNLAAKNKQEKQKQESE